MAKYLLQFTGEAKYGDWIEKLVYNGIGAALPMSGRGQTFYYSDYNLDGGRKVYLGIPFPCCSGTYPQAVDQVIKQFSPRGDRQSFQTETTIDASGYSWIAARCYVEAKSTIRMAHSRPAFLSGTWNSREDALFFLEWIDDLIEQTKTDSKRFALAGEREAVLALYDEARRVYLKKVGQSN